MITVITFNPSIDRLYKLETFKIGTVQRANFVNPTAGGKGLNVAKVIKQLGESPICLGFLGGYNGLYIKNELDKVEIVNNFTKINGESRICLNIIDRDKNSTEILEKGPRINENDILDFESKLDKVLESSKVLVASGSLSQGMPIDYYKTVGEMCNRKGVKFILDTSGKSLEMSISENLYLIKPNIEELELLTHKKINNKEDAINASKFLLEKGVKNVCISMGKDGMILLNKEHIYDVKIPKIEVLNTVGSGDSSIAGFAYGVLNDYSLKDCLKLANSCGMSNALYMETGYINKKDIALFLNEIKINEYNY